jgi:MFS family permease
VSPGGDQPHVQRDDVDALLDDRSDPAGAAFGTLGSEASSDLNWIKMLRHRVQKRATGSARYPWWVLWSLLAGLLSLNFTFTVFNIIFGQVAKQLHTTQPVMLWTSIGPILAYGVAAPVFGKLGDIFGHRRLYLMGLSGALLSAVATALAPNVGMLIFARTLDGLAGAASGTASGAILNLVFRPDERVKAGGWWSLVGAGGPVIGVSLGAPIIVAFGWRALFVVQFALIAIAIVVVSLVLPHLRQSEEIEAERRIKARHEFRKMDWIGSWTVSLAVLSLTMGTTLGSNPNFGWTAPAVFACWAVAVSSVIGFVYRLNHAANPLIPVKYFRRRNFVWPLIIRTSSNYAYFCGFFLFPYLLRYGFDGNHTYAEMTQRVGAYSIARPITFALCAPIAGYVAIKIGERTTAIFGAMFLSASMFIFAFVSAGMGVWILVIALALSGLGQGVAMPSSGAIMANEVDPSEFGVMTAVQLLAMQVGQVFGQQTSFTIQQSVMRARHLLPNSPDPLLVSTFRLSFLIGGTMAVISLIGSFFITSVPREKKLLRGDGAQPLDHSL